MSFMEVSNEFAQTIEVARANNPKNLYLHQIDALRRMSTEINSKNIYKGLLVLPTGGGKTLTAVYWILKNIIDNNKKVLWIAHRHELLNQAFDSIKSNSYSDVLPNRKRFKCRVISGMHDRPVNINPDDDILIAGKDSLSHGIDYLMNNWVIPNRDNILMVIDEAHHATAKSYRQIIDKMQNENRNYFKLLGLTATPFRTSEAEKGFMKKVFSDDIVYSIDLKTLISREILATPVFEELSTKLDMTNSLSDKDIKNITAFDTLPEDVAVEIAENKERNNKIVTHYIENSEKYGQLLVFALSINHAIVINSLFRSRNISSDYVISSVRDAFTGVTISNEENAEKIRKFRSGELKVLINVNILTEGTDLPKVQTVFLTRPSTSTILMTQMIGRALRGKKAGGTDKAYIVSFIDEWQDKIAWVNPTRLYEHEKEPIDSDKHEKREYIIRLVAISKMEEFAKISDVTFDTEKLEALPFIERVPIGLYSFSILLKIQEETSKNCDIIVYNNIKDSYENFVEGLDTFFAELKFEDNEYLDDDELEYMTSRVIKRYFNENNLSFGLHKEDIMDILRYYALKGIKPEFLNFEDREKYDLKLVAQYIWDNDFGVRRKADYIDSLWVDDKTFWKVFFANNKKYFINQLENEINKIREPVRPEPEGEGTKPGTVNEPMNIEKLSLSQIEKIKPEYYLYLVDYIYNRAKDKDGYYHSAISEFKSLKRIDFQIDHIKPMSKGGLTILENLQLLTRKENIIKGDICVKVPEVKNDVTVTGSYVDIEELDDIINKLITENKIDEAVKKVDGILGKDVDDISRNGELNTEALFLKGLIYHNTGSFDKAIEYYNEALNAYPNFSGALFNLGLIFNKKKEFSKAISCFDKTITIVPEDIEAYCQKALVLSEMGKFTEAIKCCDAAINKKPDNSEIYLCKANAYADISKDKEALECFNTSIEKDPKSYLAYIGKGKLLYNWESYERALECYIKAYNLNPGDEDVCYMIGLCQQNLKQYDLALVQFIKVLEINSLHAQANFGMAWILGYKKDYAGALKYYDKAIEVEPDLITYNNKGYTLYKMKRYNEALENYNIALKIDPNYKMTLSNKKNLLEKLSKVKTQEKPIKENSDGYSNKIMDMKLYLTAQGYLKKNPLSFPQSNMGKMLKDDVSFIQEIEAINEADLLLFSNKYSVYKLSIKECMTNGEGEFLPNLLSLDVDEIIIFITSTDTYKGFMLFSFENGKIAKIGMNSYVTKINRKKLINAYSDLSPLVNLVHIEKDCDLAAFSSIGKVLVFNTSEINCVSTKDSQGAQVLKQKSGSTMVDVKTISNSGINNKEYYRANIPAIGCYLKQEDKLVK